MTHETTNVLLIVLDALRTDCIDAYSDIYRTPNINSLSSDGEVFEECYSCINTTDPSMTTILSGQYPTRHGVVNHGNRTTEVEERFASGTDTLPHILDSSYQTTGIDTLERWHKKGFDNYINPRRKEKNKVINYAASFLTSFPPTFQDYVKNTYNHFTTDKPKPPNSDVITKNVLEEIDEDNPPFFILAHYWDTHIPYIPLEDHPEWLSNRSYPIDTTLQTILNDIEGSPWADQLTNLAGEANSVADLVRKYHAGVWKVDRQVGRIVEKLREEGLYEETAIIVTADHGESFTEHGIYFDHHGLYDPTVHVPLIIKAPGFEGQEDQFVQHFDLVPTILDLLDQDYSKERFDGISLVIDGESRPLGRDAVFMEEAHTARRRAIRTQSYKYIKRLDDGSECRYCQVSHAPDEELYDLEDDPSEEENVVDEYPDVKIRLNAQIESWIDELPAPSQDNVSFETTEEVKDHLKDMGYI